MSEPFCIGDMFKLDPENWEVFFDGTVLFIDNFYADPNSINAWLSKQDYPRWKYWPEVVPTRNGIDYDDCRLIQMWPMDTMRQNGDNEYFADIVTFLRKYFGDGNYLFDKIFEFNCFRAIKDFQPTEQHYPHFDKDRLNMVIYMDKEGNGGTKVYVGDFPKNEEYENLIFDYESIEHDVLATIPYKFNRAAIFDGRRMHGAFIEDYNHYKNNWRQTQVYFFHRQERISI